MDFGAWLVRRLDERGLRQKDLARQLRVSPAAVSQWVSGETVPADRRLPLLAGCLNVTPYEIYLRLGRVAPRGELTPEWELFIHRVEQYGPDFRQLVLEAVDSMQDAWFARPRGVPAYLDVSVRQAFYPPAAGYRGPAAGSGEKLLYFGPLRADMAVTLLLTAEKDAADDGRYTVRGLVVEARVNWALLRLAGQGYQANCQVSEMVFENVPLIPEADRLFLYADVRVL